MATKTFEELKQLAVQIRDEKTNKQNTATRVGTAMLEHINKLEQDYYDKNQTDEELKERDDKLIALSTPLGYCYGGSLAINTSEYTFTTTFLYAGIGKNGYKTINNVTNKNIVPRSDGGYNGFWAAFLNWEIVEIEIYMFSSIPTDLKNKYLIATGNGFSSSCVQFSTSNISPSISGVINEKIEEVRDDLGIYLPSKTYTVNAGQAIPFFNIEKYRGEKISVKVTGDFTQFGYYKSRPDYTVLGITPDIWVTFEVPQDATDLFVFNNSSKGTTNPTMEFRTGIANEVLENTKNIDELFKLINNDAKECVFMSLGDSIVTESYYIPKLRQILKPSKYYNLAVASATWADRSNTTSYDGDPQFQGDQSQNVLGNQVQKIINNPEIFSVAPDIIIIGAGTNDSQPINISASQQEIIADIDKHYYLSSESIPITKPTFDESDTFKEHRRTIAGAMRYVVCKLQELYPKARIYILTPIQGCYSSRNYGSSIAAKQIYISECAKHLSLPVIHVGEECGIHADFEYQGAIWNGPTDSNEKSGRDLVDGLHPNTDGSWKMAKYIAKHIINDFVDQSY